jgi:xylulokinase
MRALGFAADRLRVVGGASRNPLWCRVLADVLEVPLERLAESESGALGAAVLAAWTVGRMHGERAGPEDLVRIEGEVVEPDARARPAYREMRERFRESVRRICGAD